MTHEPPPAARSVPVDAPPRRPLIRVINGVAGSVILVAGIIIAPTPIPIGVVLIAIGLFMLSVESRRVRRLVRWLRGRAGAVDRALRRAEPRLPRSLAHMLHLTDPHLAEPAAVPKAPPPGAA